MQFTDPMKLKKKERQRVGSSTLLRKGNTILTGTNMEKKSVEQKLKEKPSRDCPNWGSIPYTLTKHRHYCGCQKMPAERSLIQVLSEKPC